MLADLGCTLVEVGHSERRRDYGETDHYVAAQVASIRRGGMTALVCVGEREQDSLPRAISAIAGQLSALAAADPARLAARLLSGLSRGPLDGHDSVKILVTKRGVAAAQACGEQACGYWTGLV